MSARVRIGRIKLKQGGADVRMLHAPADERIGQVMSAIRETLVIQESVAGYAFVAWDQNGASTSEWDRFENNPIPAPLIPDFVRARLLLGIGCRWTLDDVNSAWGLPPAS